jgi:hypothetical protein
VGRGCPGKGGVWFIRRGAVSDGVVCFAVRVLTWRITTWRVVNSLALFFFVLVTARSAGAAATKVVPCVAADLSASVSQTSGDALAVVVKNKGRRMCSLDPEISLLKGTKIDRAVRLVTSDLPGGLGEVFSVGPGRKADAMLGVYRPVFGSDGCPKRPANVRVDAVLVNRKTVLVLRRPAYFTSCVQRIFTGLRLSDVGLS